MNFRWISRIMATYSPHILTQADVVPEHISLELSELGQFAEVAYSTLPTEFIFDNLSWLLDADFPLEGYDAMKGSVLISSIRGKVADLGAYVAYRAGTKQLIVSISGTSNIKQSLQDLRTLHHKHPAGSGCKVHTGFWKMYRGIKPEVISAVKEGLRDREVAELVLTGHSLGGALSYFLVIDLLLSDGVKLPPGLPLKLAVFGAPRCGNTKLLQLWLGLVKEYRAKNGEESIKELSVKAYNDGKPSSHCIKPKMTGRTGVPSLPPKYIGFRHFAPNPLYLMEGRLYLTPSSESEYCLFHVSPEDPSEKDRIILYPRGQLLLKLYTLSHVSHFSLHYA